MMRVRDWSINRDAVKALVVVYGPAEAARQAKLPLKLVYRWAHRFGWKKAERLVRTSGYNGTHALAGKDAGDVLAMALRNHKEESILNLAQYIVDASREAKKSKCKLDVAKQVRDVAMVHQVVFPAEKKPPLIEAAILINTSVVRDNPPEMLADAEVVEE